MKKFKWISLILSAAVVFASILGCSSKPKTYTHGDWVIMHQGENECLLYDLTEQGREKEVLIFPTEVAGRKVVGVYYKKGGKLTYGYSIEFTNLRRLYFTEFVELGEHGLDFGHKVFLLYDFNEDLSNYTDYGGYSYLKNTIPNKNIHAFPANVSYYYNYENAPFDGFYWLDDYSNEIIKYPPINPVREGYEFAGWYKEPECINKWNFETDIIPQKEYYPEWSAQIDFQKERYVYKETALYAKWVKI